MFIDEGRIRIKAGDGGDDGDVLMSSSLRHNFRKCDFVPYCEADVRRFSLGGTGMSQ
jgi:hypothetical protein